MSSGAVIERYRSTIRYALDTTDIGTPATPIDRATALIVNTLFPEDRNLSVQESIIRRRSGGYPIANQIFTSLANPETVKTDGTSSLDVSCYVPKKTRRGEDPGDLFWDDKKTGFLVQFPRMVKNGDLLALWINPGTGGESYPVIVYGYDLMDNGSCSPVFASPYIGEGEKGSGTAGVRVDPDKLREENSLSSMPNKVISFSRKG